VIWRQTDDDRCGLPWIVFDDGFGIERWVDWILDVPMLFRRKGDGLVPPDGSTFRDLLEGPRGAEVELEDWATHCSSIFTDVRCYTYMEVRSADLQPDDRAFAVPAFWTGILYDDDAIDAVIDACHDLDYAGWRRAMDSAARHGLDGTVGRWSVRELAQRAVGHAVRAIERGVPCAGDGSSVRYLERLASFVNLDVKV
jgi:glutamate--cysteine ligase